MKKLVLLTTAVGLCVVSTYGQGTINFANGASSVVTWTNGPAGGLAGTNNNGDGEYWGGTSVELFYQPGSSNAPAPILASLVSPITMGSWEATASSHPFALTGNNGRFGGGAETTGTDVPGGANAWLTVVGWTGPFSSLQAAIVGGGLVGESTIFELTTGNPSSVPAGNPVSLTAAPVAGTPFSGLVLGVYDSPEPNSLAIIGLGGAAFILSRLRRRRSN